MRLDWIDIPSYRNLRSFHIDFDEKQPTTVLIGRNGTGKSNLIEALVEIFRELELGGTPTFTYSLQYFCRERTIRIDADPSRSTRRLEITVDGKPLTQTAFQRDMDTYLPNYVFAYYSGWSGRLERHFDRPTRKHYERILKSPDRELPLRRLFFCRREYSQLVLLAFFLAGPAGTDELVRRYLDIKQFESALFVLKKPWWRGGGAPTRIQKAEGDPLFWYARGAFKGFLTRLWRVAFAPIRNTEAVERDVRRQGETTERLYLFIKNAAELNRLRERNEDAKTLFGYLESLFLCDLIDEVRVTVERVDGTRVKFTQLSEGEQQLLTVLGLLLFTQNDESLYLLDEPDTHLNPVWTYDFLSLLQENIRAEKGHLIVATHNPLMIGSLRKNQVRVLSRGDNRIIAEEPEYDPIGIGVEGLLKSELYGLRSTLAREVLDDIDTQNRLLALPKRSAAQERALSQASARLAKLSITRSHPNPLFDLFARAVAEQPIFKKPLLSKEEIDEQEKLANEILSKILREENP
jgi:predicted ATPase